MSPALMKTARIRQQLAKREQLGKSRRAGTEPRPRQSGIFRGFLRVWTPTISVSFLARSLTRSWTPTDSTPLLNQAVSLLGHKAHAQDLDVIRDGWWLRREAPTGGWPLDSGFAEEGLLCWAKERPRGGLSGMVFC